jgi:hypothetical protein
LNFFPYLDAEDASKTVARSTFAVHGPIRVGAQGLVVGRTIQRDGGKGGGAAASPAGKGDEETIFPDLNTKGHLVFRDKGAGLDGGSAGISTWPVKVNLKKLLSRSATCKLTPSGEFLFLFFC